MINQHSSTAEKIALFQSLFRGRSAVYPRRFQNRKTQKSGYAPACNNEWAKVQVGAHALHARIIGCGISLIRELKIK